MTLAFVFGCRVTEQLSVRNSWSSLQIQAARAAAEAQVNILFNCLDIIK